VNGRWGVQLLRKGGVGLAENIAGRIGEKAAPVLGELGYDLADLEYVKEGANWYLRFFIEHLDTEAPMSIDDCQKASERLSAWLDEADPIPQAYFLEVSSPGVERPLKKEKDFVRFQGYMVQITTYAPYEGKKLHLGLLGPASEKEITIRQEDKDLTIEREKISGVRLYWTED
jgi:ribosome maturation factor RimP